MLIGAAASGNCVTITAEAFTRWWIGGRDEMCLPAFTQLFVHCCFVACNPQDVCDFLFAVTCLLNTHRWSWGRLHSNPRWKQNWFPLLLINFLRFVSSFASCVFSFISTCVLCQALWVAFRYEKCEINTSSLPLPHFMQWHSSESDKNLFFFENKNHFWWIQLVHTSLQKSPGVSHWYSWLCAGGWKVRRNLLSLYCQPLVSQ